MNPTRTSKLTIYEQVINSTLPTQKQVESLLFFFLSSFYFLFCLPVGVLRFFDIPGYTISIAVGSMSDALDRSLLTNQIDAVDMIRLLPAVNDDHGGVIVDVQEPMDSKVFVGALRASMSQWKHEGKKGVWIKLPIGLANLIEIVVKEGFWYHHAEPNYLMLVYWIPETICTIPANATHRVGVGAIVLTENREMLVVQEKSGGFRGLGIWKIPTGVVDEGEDICAAAVREVKEETGIDAEFIEVVAFRQTHKAFFEKSDFFFLCFLRPLSFNIQRQELEIEAAQWMALPEFAAQPIAQKSGLFKRIIDLCLVKLDKNYAGFSPVSVSSSDDKPPYLYMNTRDLHQSSHTTTSQL
ncbi:nudix hydrolase 10-like [Chenopodium quinoa]|uniref:nudix hydrolase 10-like n=1 Tax=Chenopodium quinoa TaxID=63459 RepID=UPI000B799780|nr:nudix hydrolase 10-like [Chenopodium quinoa]